MKITSNRIYSTQVRTVSELNQVAEDLERKGESLASDIYRQGLETYLPDIGVWQHEDIEIDRTKTVRENLSELTEKVDAADLGLHESKDALSDIETKLETDWPDYIDDVLECIKSVGGKVTQEKLQPAIDELEKLLNDLAETYKKIA